MRVIPVIDLLSGVVVHAKKGERENYRPVDSVLTPSKDPLVIGEVFKEVFGFKEVYIADLDAIQSSWALNNFSVLEKLSSLDLGLMVDCGIDSPEKAKATLDLGINKVVIGTETLSSLKQYEEIVGKIGEEKVVLSLDLKDGKLLGEISKEVEKDPLKLLKKVSKIGAKEIIILELSKVGTGRGIPEKLIKKLSKTTTLPIIIGGGVKDIEDVKKARELGAEGVLIATALHTGKIKPKDLKTIT
ncbi:MAG: HisA/HisF-related TIM barrel protein [Candidatus Hodarchaeota archaeon]